MKALKIEIKAKLSVEDYKAALPLCQRILSFPDGKTFDTLSTYGTCAANLGEKDSAINSFEEALLREDSIEHPHRQKILKNLADLCEDTSNWEKMIWSLSKLYDIVSEKGNLDRSFKLAEKILEIHKKLKSFDAGMQFAVEHMKKVDPSIINHSLNIIVLFSELQELDASKKLPKFASINETMKELSREAIFPAEIINRLQTILLEKIPDPENPVISKLVLRYSNSLRSHKKANRPIQLDFLLDFISAMPSCLQHTPEVTHHLVEAFLLASPSQGQGSFSPKVLSVMDLVSQRAPTNDISYTVMKLLESLNRGCILTLKPLLLRCSQHALTALDTSSSTNPILSTTSAPASAGMSLEELMSQPLNVIDSYCIIFSVISFAFHDFQGINNEDMLHLIEEGSRRLNLLHRSVQTKEDADTTNFSYFEFLMKLSRIIATSKLFQISKARSDFITLLEYFELVHPSSNPEEGSSQPLPLASPLALLENSWNVSLFTSSPFSWQWLLLITLRTVKLFNHVTFLSQVLITNNDYKLKSWVILEACYSDILQSVDLAFSTLSNSETLIPLEKTLIANIKISEVSAAGYIKRLQSALKAGDELVSQIEPLVKSRMGFAMWLAGGRLRSDKNACIATLLSAAKLDPQDSSVFTFIGHYYSEELKDADRASKCYLKALKGDFMNREAGISLCKLYISQGDNEKADALLQEVSMIATHAHWCFALKAQISLRREDFDSAINNFQLALEIDEHDGSCWFGLGQSYACANQNAAAYKALLKAVEIFPSDINVVTALADIERKNSSLQKSKARFEYALTLDDNDVIALKGLGSVYLGLAYEHIAMGWTQGAARDIRSGLNAIKKNISSFTNNIFDDFFWICIYKLKGDLCVLARSVGPLDLKFSDIFSSTELANIPSWLVENNENIFDDQINYIIEAEESFNKVINFATKNESLTSDSYFDLASAYYQHSTILLLAAGQGSGFISTEELLTHGNALDMLLKAKEMFSRGLELDPLHSRCWNGLGLCLFKSYDIQLRRFCFVRATQIDNNAAAYSNLGIDLLASDQENEAQECFSALQLIESNPSVWVSLGCAFEMRTPTKDSINKTYDSFQAACEIAKPVDSLLGSAISWLKVQGSISPSDNRLSTFQACSILNSFEMNELRHEVELKLKSFLIRKPIHSLGWALLGWVHELQGNFETAQKNLLNSLFCLNIVLENALNENIPESHRVIYLQKIEKVKNELLTVLKRCTSKASSSLNSSSSMLNSTGPIFSKFHHLIKSFPNFSSDLKSALTPISFASAGTLSDWNDDISRTMCSIISTDISSSPMEMKELFSQAINLVLHQSKDSRRCFYFTEILKLATSKCSSASVESGIFNAFTTLLTEITAELEMSREEGEEEEGNEAVRVESNYSHPALIYVSNSSQACAYFVKLVILCNIQSQRSELETLIRQAATQWHATCSYFWLMMAEIEATLPLEKVENCLKAIDIVKLVRCSSLMDNDGVGLVKPRAIELKNIDLPLSQLEVMVKSTITLVDAVKHCDEEEIDQKIGGSEIIRKYFLRTLHLYPAESGLLQYFSFLE